MNSQKGFVIPLIIAIVAILAIGGGVYFYNNKRADAPVINSQANSTASTTGNLIGGDKDIHGCLGPAGYSWCAVKNKCLRVWEEKCEATSTQIIATTTIVTNKNDVVRQAAYLIAAYTKSGKNYIDVDYVNWLSGEASIKAKIEDGVCLTVTNCEAFPNGYEQNKNPTVRTFEVSCLVSINASGLMNGILDSYKTNGISISFTTFEKVASSLKPLFPSKPPFKNPLDFIMINVKNNIVTDINEPYQE
jgi:hypothetical protein